MRCRCTTRWWRKRRCTEDTLPSMAPLLPSSSSRMAWCHHKTQLVPFLSLGDAYWLIDTKRVIVLVVALCVSYRCTIVSRPMVCHSRRSCLLRLATVLRMAPQWQPIREDLYHQWVWRLCFSTRHSSSRHMVTQAVLEWWHGRHRLA